MSRKRKKTGGRPGRAGGTAPTPSSRVTQPTPARVSDIVASASRSARPSSTAATPAVDPPPPTEPAGALEAFVARVAPEVVGISYTFDPPAQPSSQVVTLRLSGRRLGVAGRPGLGDTFVHEEAWAGVVGGSGPVAVTTKVRDVTPGDWQVDAQAYTSPAGSAVSAGARRRLPVQPAAWSWRRWRITATSSAPVTTRLAPLVRPPAVVLGSWLALVVTGIAVALVTQALVLAAESVPLAHTLIVSLSGVLAGAVGAKLWYVVLHRADGRRDGWTIQGFVTGLTAAVLPLLWLSTVPVGPYLDASAPGLLFGMAAGRVGCFLTGCCAGRPTASRWGVWSSNRAVCARRVPVQPMESVLAGTAGVAALAAVLAAGPRHGSVFVAALAFYTLIRQSLLLLREEPRRTRLGAPLVAAGAAAMLVAAVVVAALS